MDGAATLDRRPGLGGMHQTDVGRAITEGLRFRPVAETLAGAAAAPAVDGVGLTPEREADAPERVAGTMRVAYPGREGAHSAAACALLFPEAETEPLPSFSDVVEAVAFGRFDGGVLPIESSVSGPVSETHDLLVPLGRVDQRADDPPDPALPRRRRGDPAERDPHRPLAPGRARPVPASARLPPRGDGDRGGHDRGRGRARGAGRRPDGDGDRERARRGSARPRGARRGRGRPSRGLHPLRRGLEPDAARPRRELADRVLLPDRPPSRARSTARSSRSRVTRSTSSS